MSIQPERPFKDQLHIYGPALLVILLGFILAYQFVKPAPSKHIRIATGSTSGAYYLFAQQYQKLLAQERIELEIINTAGSIENIDQLKKGQADVAFIQGGTTNPEQPENLLSLGSLYFEPIWVFHRKSYTVNQLGDLKQLRIAIDKEGSGTRALAIQLLGSNGVTHSNSQLVDASGRQAADDLLSGKIDVAFFVTSPMSPVVRALLDSEQIELMSFERADAYTRIHRYLSSVILPEGVINLDKNLPRQSTVLLAASANLVVRDDLHPALMDLLLQAADAAHAKGGWFEQNGQFPAASYLVYPLSDAAKRFYKYGPPFLQRYLPFWAATLVDRLKVLLLPLVALMIPLFKIMPPIYRWRIRSRIYRWYREVLTIDRQLLSSDVDLDGATRELARIETEVCHVSVPLSFAEELYDLRLHINLVKDKLVAMRPAI